MAFWWWGGGAAAAASGGPVDNGDVEPVVGGTLHQAQLALMGFLTAAELAARLAASLTFPDELSPPPDPVLEDTAILRLAAGGPWQPVQIRQADAGAYYITVDDDVWARPPIWAVVYQRPPVETGDERVPVLAEEDGRASVVWPSAAAPRPLVEDDGFAPAPVGIVEDASPAAVIWPVFPVRLPSIAGEDERGPTVAEDDTPSILLLGAWSESSSPRWNDPDELPQLWAEDEVGTVPPVPWPWWQARTPIEPGDELVGARAEDDAPEPWRVASSWVAFTPPAPADDGEPPPQLSVDEDLSAPRGASDWWPPRPGPTSAGEDELPPTAAVLAEDDRWVPPLAWDRALARPVQGVEDERTPVVDPEDGASHPPFGASPWRFAAPWTAGDEAEPPPQLGIDEDGAAPRAVVWSTATPYRHALDVDVLAPILVEPEGVPPAPVWPWSALPPLPDTPDEIARVPKDEDAGAPHRAGSSWWPAPRETAADADEWPVQVALDAADESWPSRPILWWAVTPPRWDAGDERAATLDESDAVPARTTSAPWRLPQRSADEEWVPAPTLTVDESDWAGQIVPRLWQTTPPVALRVWDAAEWTTPGAFDVRIIRLTAVVLRVPYLTGVLVTQPDLGAVALLQPSLTGVGLRGPMGTGWALRLPYLVSVDLDPGA